jgi:hypothetical protein
MKVLTEPFWLCPEPTNQQIANNQEQPAVSQDPKELPTGHPELRFDLDFPDTTNIIDMTRKAQAIFQQGSGSV